MISTTPSPSKPQNKRASRRTPSDRSGFGFLLFAGLITCVMLVGNGALVSMAYPAIEQFSNWIASLAPWVLSGTRLSQLLMLAMPIALIFGEWWLIDFLVDHLRGRRNER